MLTIGAGASNLVMSTWHCTGSKVSSNMDQGHVAAMWVVKFFQILRSWPADSVRDPNDW